MKSSLPHKLIRRMVAARLAEDERTSGFTYHHAIPPDAVWPFVVFVGLLGTSDRTSTTTGHDLSLTLRVSTRFPKGQATGDVLADMMDAVEMALTDLTLVLEGEHVLVMFEPELAEELPPYDDDAYTYLEGVLRFQLVTQYVEDE